jgi:hypothetical protein
MTRSRGQFDTRHDDERDADSGRDGVVGDVAAWVAFHRVEFVLVCWLVVGAIGVGTVFGVFDLLAGKGSVPELAQTVFWVTVLLAIPLLTVALVVHAAVDAYRVALADGDVTSWGRAAVRGLQTASVATFLLGVKVLAQDTAPADVEFDPAALVSAFLLVVGFTGMVGFVAVDGVVRLVRGTW